MHSWPFWPDLAPKSLAHFEKKNLENLADFILDGAPISVRHREPVPVTRAGMIVGFVRPVNVSAAMPSDRRFDRRDMGMLPARTRQQPMHMLIGSLNRSKRTKRRKAKKRNPMNQVMVGSRNHVVIL
jgi:hypothetical protein